MKILAIDTSCDDTSAAVSEDQKILAHVLWSKLKTHDKWGGVVPSEARRQHQEFLDPVVEEVFKESGVAVEEIDAIAVTYGPGLAIALEAGITKAKEICQRYNKPLIAVNHMVGHIYSSLAQDQNGESYSGIDDFKFPLLALAASGGHTDLYLMKNHLQFEHLGQTLDDAVGESFDKVGRMLGMGFPAGAKIEQAAKNGDPLVYNFPRPMADSADFNWSFSGLKTSVLYQIKKLIGEYKIKPEKKTHKLEDLSERLSESQINDLAASFQLAAIESITIKIKKALQKFEPKMLVIGGGVIANTLFRTELKKVCDENNVPIYYPNPMWLCTDNAAMIAVAGYFIWKELGDKAYYNDLNRLDRVPNLPIK